jgi:type III secretion protein Q
VDEASEFDDLADINRLGDSWSKNNEDGDQSARKNDRAPIAARANLLLEYCACGGKGVELSLLINGRPARVWVDENAWCEWLSPRLTVQHVDQIPEPLRTLLGEWALAPLSEHVAAARLGDVSFVSAIRADCQFESAPTLTVGRDGRKLMLRLISCPPDWIAAFANTMEDRSVALALPPVIVRLAAGWIHLTRAQVNALRPGDGIVLEHETHVEHGEAWMVTDRVIARIKALRDDVPGESGSTDFIWKIDDVIKSGDSMSDPSRSTLIGDIDHNPDANGKHDRGSDPLRTQFTDEKVQFIAMVEVARMTMSLDALRGLRKGQMLEIGHVSGLVALTISGRTCATGSLLRVGDKLVMRIE